MWTIYGLQRAATTNTEILSKDSDSGYEKGLQTAIDTKRGATTLLLDRLNSPYSYPLTEFHMSIPISVALHWFGSRLVRCNLSTEQIYVNL
jgi:hypothetical protein